MKKILIMFAALSALVSCQLLEIEFGKLSDEWSPVFVLGDYKTPPEWEPVTEEWLRANEGLESFTTIRELKALYKGHPVYIYDNIWICGRVSSSDRTGNVYREMYIQDETGGIDIKIGKSSLYSDYQLGQWIYVKCTDLTLGAYSGMPQLGVEADQTTTNDYETSYIDNQGIINSHIFRGQYDDPVKPVEVTESALKAALSSGFTGELWGKYVSIKGLKYSNEIFALVYPNPNLPHTSSNPENRIFLSDSGTWGVDTWACSKTDFINYVNSGLWDKAEVGSGATRYGPITKTPRELGVNHLDSFGAEAEMTYKEIMVRHATACYISHYFKLGGTSVQVRTSGFSRFCADKLDPALAAGSPCTITGILSIYNGSAQISLIDEPAVSVVIQ